MQEHGIGLQPFLSGKEWGGPTAHDQRCSIDFFGYCTTLRASLDAGRISPDGSTFSNEHGTFGSPVATDDDITPPYA
jgi:hypothetical protein